MWDIKKIPRPVLVALVLIGGALFIILSDPPKDVCDAQLEIFMSSQKGRISSFSGRVPSLWARTASLCQKSQTLGGCAEFHESVRLAIRDLRNAPPECNLRLITNESISKVLTNSLELMVRSAWGSQTPELGPSTFGWMGMREFFLFCEVKTFVQRILLDEEWEAFVRRIVWSLPKAKDLSFEEAFVRSLFSLRCEAVRP